MDWQQKVHELEAEVQYLRRILDTHHISYNSPVFHQEEREESFVCRVITVEMARFFLFLFSWTERCF